MNFTDDELVTLIEALREYRLRVSEPSRLLVSEALVYRLGAQLVDNAKTKYQKGLSNG